MVCPSHPSWLHRQPAAFKLAVVLLFVCGVVLLPGHWLPISRHVPISTLHVASLACVVLALWWSKVAWRPMWRRLALFATGWGTCLLGMLLWTPSAGRSHLWELGVKGLVSFLALYLLAATTPAVALAAALRQLGLPQPMISVILCVERFRHLLRLEAERMQRAQRARTFSHVGRGRRAAASAALVGMLLVRASRRAQRVYAAMLARGYREAPVESRRRGRIEEHAAG